MAGPCQATAHSFFRTCSDHISGSPVGLWNAARTYQGADGVVQEEKREDTKDLCPLIL